MKYHRTRSSLGSKERRGQYSITSTLTYTPIGHLEGDEEHAATAKAVEEDKELIKTGFEYDTERDGIKSYRKRK